DDGSYDTRFARIWKKLYPTIQVLQNKKNSGFAKAVNLGIKNATGDLILLLNNDCHMDNASWLTTMVNTLENDKLDMTAPAGGRMNKKWEYIDEVRTKGVEFTYLPGFCLLIKREVFDKIGNIPEYFGAGFWEDNLFCYRAKRAGFKLGISENVGINHLPHSTFKEAGIDIRKQYLGNREMFLNIMKGEK
ncbi:MAG TPA: glycosyltransferase family 2 protein, partial [bacterium]|nr:glycosyltransferase family 2 protein [bacterium]